MFIDNKYKLKTGDILLFDNKGSGIMGIFSTLIKKITKSNISHVAMVLFIHHLKGSMSGNPIMKGNLIHKMVKLNLVSK